jgi:hypothetical protein
VQPTHPKLQECAIITARIATATEATNDQEYFLDDVPPEERTLPDFSTPWPWDIDSFVVALSIAQETREATAQGLEELVATWLGEDPEHWPVLRPSLIDPWKELAGIWSADMPEWIRTLSTIATTAHAKVRPLRSPPDDEHGVIREHPPPAADLAGTVTPSGVDARLDSGAGQDLCPWCAPFPASSVTRGYVSQMPPSGLQGTPDVQGLRQTAPGAQCAFRAHWQPTEPTSRPAQGPPAGAQSTPGVQQRAIGVGVGAAQSGQHSTSWPNSQHSSTALVSQKTVCPESQVRGPSTRPQRAQAGPTGPPLVVWRPSSLSRSRGCSRSWPRS